MLKRTGYLIYCLGVAVLFIALIILQGCRNSDINLPVENNSRLQLSKTDKMVLSSSGTFGLKLFSAINENEKDKNIFISPLSISTAFGMALNGAKGETYDEMVKTLELSGLSTDDINKSNKYLIETLPTIDPKVKFQIANSIWNRQGFSVIPDFLNVNKQYYNAEVRELNFSLPDAVTIINKWIADKTNNKIDKVLDSIDPAVVMYLINALYFKGDWKVEFNEKNTIKSAFSTHPGTKVKSLITDFMVQKRTFRYYENNNIQAVDLPYGDSLYSMTVIVPKENGSVDELIKNMTALELQNITDGLKQKAGTLMLPKFKYTFFKEMSEILKKLGMVKAFNGSADFSKITPGGGIYISRVLHKAFVEVNEKGTEAAAVTVIEFEKTSISTDFYMNVDRPFIFFIRESSTNTILFAGKIADPTKNEN